MGSRALLLIKGQSLLKHNILLNYKRVLSPPPTRKITVKATTNGSSLEPPDVASLAATAELQSSDNRSKNSLLKFNKSGQLATVDLNNVEPSIKAGTESDNLRDDFPETFENREAVVAAIPNYEEPYIKVPKVLNIE